MKGYGQFCPVSKGAEIFAERWTPLVIREMLAGSTRFNDIHRGVPLMSRTLLSRRLKQLVDAGVAQHSGGPGDAQYRLTEAGREFAPIVYLLGEWGHRWFRSKFGPDELDVGLLMWEMRRTVKPDVFPAGKTSVKFDIADQPEPKRHWWIVNDLAEADLCPVDPGLDIGLFVTTDLATLTRIWMGEISVGSAVATGRIELDGEQELRRRFEGWLGLSCFADSQGERPSKRAAAA